MFERKYLGTVNKVGVNRQCKCNAGIVSSDEKGYLLDMFNMWLVEAGIANLLSIPCLERSGCKVSYGDDSVWRVKCPNGGTLSFKKDVGVCEGFPYVDLDNLEEHWEEPSDTGGVKITVLSRMKNAMGTNKTKAYLCLCEYR